MPSLSSLAALAITAARLVGAASQAYTWKNVKIGGGGGFVPGIVFNPSQKGLAFCRYVVHPLIKHARWNYWGVAALATDPVQPNRLYLAVGEYLNSWDPNNGNILISTDTGATFTPSPLPFKVGGNMPGRGMGEQQRLAVDPNLNSVLYFGAGGGKGLWKSTNFGASWTQVTAFPSVGTYVPDASDSNGYNSAPIYVLSLPTYLPTDFHLQVSHGSLSTRCTSGSSGTATPRIFVGVANVGTTNIYMSTNAGSSWTAVPGQNTTYLPHKGVLSPSEKVLYVSYSNGAGPYDGTLGAVMKYNIATSTWTDITPVVDSSLGGPLYYGFGGLTVDLQTPGTVMVAALNSWWPDGQIFRSLNSGSTWSPLWNWQSYPTMNKFYHYSDSLAPWIGPNYVDGTPGNTQIGWMMESLQIDPFDGNHWLYGTGETIYGGRDLKTWDTKHNVSISSLADGIEETSVQALISPPSGPPLISALGDIQGFVHNSLTTPPPLSGVWSNPQWSTTADLDYAGNAPSTIVRIGTGDSSQGKQVAISNDGGATWAQDYGAADNVQGGKVAISANGDTVLWRTAGQGVLVSQYTNAFAAVSSLPAAAVIASDKRNNSVFYAAYASSFYLSTDGGKTFAVKATLGSSNNMQKIAVHPSVTGDVWVTSDNGLFHSTNMGSTFTKISGPTAAWQMALGAPKTAGGYPALFVAANIGGIGYFRSDDQGTNWIQINDAAHGFGSVSSNPIAADLKTYGRVYIGTNGRGIFYGDVAGTAPPPSSSSSATRSSTVLSSSTVKSSSSSVKPSSSSTVKSSSTVSSTTSAPPSTGTAGAYAQCGGQGWTGPTVCTSGFTCVAQNTFYSQCVPS
ncbi:Carbohydrate-binding module family 1 protein [Mycena indigotica]|uniref:Carbohydrate-binding module family 1 protein n=1 Tax=Mycena indigotica TaxID=2126181 RepID=A0A8H6SV03_9AGAR|nr:Carbohydrate-binding module family 1 protein [Mycena indigotica]KAF7306680.1 Carbohydrate-binding module family 1 protein [Mycena indigotica]